MRIDSSQHPWMTAPETAAVMAALGFSAAEIAGFAADGSLSA